MKMSIYIGQMDLIRKVFLGIFGWILVFSAIGQEPFLRKHVLPEPFNQAIVNCIHQGAQEKIWLGTDLGLVFFDGQDAELFAANHPAFQSITTLNTDLKGRLWAGSANGMLGIVNERNKSVEHLFSNEIGSAITAISHQATSGPIFSTYKNGIFSWSENRLEALSIPENAIKGDIYDLTIDEDQMLWVATDIGLVALQNDEQVGQWSVITGRHSNTPDEIVHLVQQYQKNKICIGTQRGHLAFYDKLEKEWESYQMPVESLIEDIAFVNKQEIWVATKRKGIWIFNPAAKKWKPIAETSGRAFDLEFDQEGNIWFFTEQMKLISTNRYFDYLDLGISDIQCVLHTQGGIWMGTKMGLYFWDGKNDLSSPRSALRAINVISLHEDVFGNIWAGTFGDGIRLYQPGSRKVKSIGIDEGLTNGNILDIAGLGKKIWLATLGGVMEIELREDLFSNGKLNIKNYNQNSGLGTNFIYCVHPDRQGRVWFGTDGKGLSVLENGLITAFSEGQGVTADQTEKHSFPTVYSIVDDKQGNIWFSTPENDVFSFNGKHFNKLKRPAFVRDFAITGLESDGADKILILHENGIDHLIPKLNHQMYFGKYVGLDKFQPNLNSSSIDAQGNIWIATNDYIVRCQRLEKVVKIHPSTIITNVSASLQAVDWQVEHELKHHQNQLIFNYAGLWYTDPNAVRYRYRLKGYDKDWIVSKDLVATYSSLPAGEYTFEVMSTENMDFHAEPISQYTFEIKPAFWQRAWFVALMIILGLGLIYGYIKLRDQRVRKLERLKKEKAESQLEALKTQINPHFLFNNFNTLISIIEDEPKIAVEYVEHLSDFYRSILKYREQTLIPLSEELRTLENYAFLLRKRFGNNFLLSIEVDSPELKVIPLSLQRLVENAMKHNTISKANPLEISIRQSGKRIKVTNTINPKIKPEKSTGFGLSSLRKQYQLIAQGTVEVKISKSEFEVSLPAI